jgi:hypothetical protein
MYITMKTILNDNGLGNFKAISVYMTTNDSYRSFKIPYAKHSLNEALLKTSISQTFKVSNLDIQEKNIRLTFK